MALWPVPDSCGLILDHTEGLGLPALQRAQVVLSSGARCTTWLKDASPLLFIKTLYVLHVAVVAAPAAAAAAAAASCDIFM